MRTFPSSSRARQRSRGFTLIEMMMALVIMILLFTAVCEITGGVLRSSATLLDNQNHRDLVVALNAYLKRRLGEMSAQASLLSYRRGDGEGLLQNGIIMGIAQGSDGPATAIDAKVQPNGYYTLRLVTLNPDDGPPQEPRVTAFSRLLTLVTQDDPSLPWVTLIHDVQKPAWKFQEYNVVKWEDQWPNPSRPNLVEFTLQIAGDLRPVTMDFWVPTLVPASLSVPQSAAPAANGN